MFESESADLLDRMRAASRVENRAAGERLAAIADLDALRLRQFGERETWCGDTWDAICAEVAAALQISQALAASFLNYARAMRNRLPHVGAALLAGDIGYATFQTVVYRTDLITDPEVLARVDAALAARLTRWVGMTRGRLNASVDRIVARADKGAVRRRRERQAGREFWIWDVGDGLTEVFGRLLSTDAHAVDAKLTALAATVCHGDPRTAMQRRADAMGAMAAGAERLPCRCGQPGCPAGGCRVPSSVMIHVIANQSTVDGRRRRRRLRLPGRQRRAVSGGTDRRIGRLGAVAAGGAFRRRAAGTRPPSLAGAGRLRALSRPDVPVPRL